MMEIFPESVMKLWNQWELRGMVFLSLCLQIVLIICGNRRKYTAKKWINIFIWVAYLSADWVATVSLGVLSNIQANSTSNSPNPDSIITAFWAPFLLVHLGGPDTITAYSLEDNELWLRHLLGILVQIGLAFFVILRSWTNNPLTFLAILLFLSGIVKCGERTWVLWSASSEHFRNSLLPAPDPGPDYAEFMEECGTNLPGGMIEKMEPECCFQVDDEILPEAKLIHEAYFLFQMFKRLYSDLILSFHERQDSISIFEKRSSVDAFKLIEIELGFMYDVLYSKTSMAYSRTGIFLRSFCLLSSVSAFVAFWVAVHKACLLKHGHDHILSTINWSYFSRDLRGSISLVPSFLDDPYNSGDISDYSWWVQGQYFDIEQVNNTSPSFNSTSTITTATSASPSDPVVSNHPPPPDSSKKRKVSVDPVPKASQNYRKNQNRRMNDADDGEAVIEQGVTVRRSGGTKKGTTKSAGNNCNNGNNKEGRWAEHLLNPCAAAITAGNQTRVQHLLYVLHELASATGDANHRLAYHGLKALSHYLFSGSSSVSVGPSTFATTKPQFFQKSLLKFYDVSPWFIFHNNIANASMLQILKEQDRSRNLHILDIGVSHGAQWPTLLEALTRRPGGPPPLVRITVIAATIDNDQASEPPFAIGPPGDNYFSRLLLFAKSMNINLQINRLDNHPLQNLSAQLINSVPDETLIVCTQFRLHHLNHHHHSDDRTEFLRGLRNLEPKGVILSENNMDCSCNNCGDFATGFSRRLEFLWRFLDSTSVAFKGRENDERRVMEGEAAKALTNLGEMNEGKEKWCQRMKGVGFVEEVFGEDAIDGARALMRKYDSNWEMRVEERDGCVGLWWKGQSVSFCSLWKSDTKANDS
ncbi:hypothetical protein F0562_022787 [Nyssa sinensis]|uniref:DUF4220 domain-containing protein n=1 Tax=Nyssa sinensis TaxID=561372 RepID=A0A5J5BEN9_9ASTE|nr:hypothetical protein F0562_022787 [Nyssa sinensis]